MKLLYITQMYPDDNLPQYCVFIHLQVKALISRGVEITVVIPSAGRPSGRTVYDGVDVIYLNYRDISRTALYPLVARRLSRELRAYLSPADYDIVYAVHASANILDFARRLSVRYGKPLVVHYRGFNIFEEFVKEPKVPFSDPVRVRERVVKASALSIGVSRKVTEVITDRFPGAPVCVVYNGVDSSVFSGSPADSSSPSHDPSVIRLLCVANLIPIKGHKYLFDAVLRLSELHPELTITTDVVGRGSYEDELRRYVADNRVPGVVFCGYVGHDEVAGYMHRADIFVLPSVYEAMANVCFEAMACGKPVVIFRGQGTDEIIEDGVSGMIADKGSAGSLAAKIDRLITDPDLRRSIAARGRRIVQGMTWDLSAENIIKALEPVISAGRKQ